jgi:hypothetical protein
MNAGWGLEGHGLEYETNIKEEKINMKGMRTMGRQQYRYSI